MCPNQIVSIKRSYHYKRKGDPEIIIRGYDSDLFMNY